MTTLRTVHRLMVSAPGSAFKKCAPIFYKLLGMRSGRKLELKLENLSFAGAVFLLKFRDFLFEQNKLVLQQSEAFLEHHRRAVLRDESLNLSEDRDGHRKPSVMYAAKPAA
jgi:hypothetical protein